jgi:peptide deformylase
MIKIIDPHKKISKEVTISDISKVMLVANDMLDFCRNPKENFKRILAIAHCQIELENPLRFFVTETGEIIINPKIIRHTNTTVDSQEGCLSFPGEPSITVQRWNRCEVGYQIIENNKFLYVAEGINGQRSKMFQHEIDHFNGKYIYET